MKKMGLVMVVVVMVLLGLCACAKRQSKLDKMTADLQKLVYDISRSTGSIVSSPSVQPDTTDIGKYVSYGEAPGIVVNKTVVLASTVTITETRVVATYADYGSSYGGEVSKPIEPISPPLNVKLVSLGTHSGIGTKPVLASSTGVVVDIELTTGQKIGRFVKIVLVILVLMGLTVYLLRNKKSV